MKKITVKLTEEQLLAVGSAIAIALRERPPAVIRGPLRELGRKIENYFNRHWANAGVFVDLIEVEEKLSLEEMLTNQKPD